MPETNESSTDASSSRILIGASSFAMAFCIAIFCSQYIFPTPHLHYANDLPPVALMAVGLSFAVLLGAASIASRRVHSSMLNFIYLLALMTLVVTVTAVTGGVYSPFSVFWIWVMFISYLSYSKAGLAIATIVFTATSLSGLYITAPSTTVQPINSLIFVIAIMLSSLIVIASQSTKYRLIHDLTRSHRREEAERNRTITLINNITDAVFSINGHGIVTIHNSSALNLLDTNEDIVGHHIDEIVKIENLDGKLVPTFKELSKNGSIRRRDDIIMRLADEDTLRLEATFAPIQNSSVDSEILDNYVLILRDVTRLKSLEEERDEFISVVSHELRTPVTVAEASISNSILLNERGLKEKSNESIHEAHHQIVFLSKMINDLGTLARAERGISDEPEEIEVFDLINQLGKENSLAAEKKGLGLNVTAEGEPKQIHVSRLYLHELLQNLVTNAIRYTHKGVVTISAKTTKSRVMFSVSDTGIGISKPDQKLVFKRFYRAEDYRTRETNGTGLGLYISAKLARKLGTKIELESRLNHGSSFSFSIKIKSNNK